MSFVTYKNSKRKDLNGSQAESSLIKIEDTKCTFSGYQNYAIDKSGKIVLGSSKLNNQWKLLCTISLNGNSITDLGCSNGAIGLAMQSQYGFKQVNLFDHDTECIQNLQKCKEWMKPAYSLQIKKFSFGIDQLETVDYIVTLSTIHWFYSATTAIGCLETILAELSKRLTKALIIEWVEPIDGAINCLHHISLNKDIQKKPYTKENFLKGLQNNFVSFKKIGHTSATRELYIAFK
jgi:hypothetical protein